MDGEDKSGEVVERGGRSGKHRDASVDLAIVEHINGLALLGARRLIATRKALKGVQKVRLLPFFATSLAKEGRPGLLLIVDVTRTLALRGEMTISDLAEAAGRTLSTASRLVDGLEAAGLVKRSGNPADGRSLLVGLTDEGRRVVDELRAEAAIPLLGRLERLSTKERRTLAGLLAKLGGPEGPEGEAALEEGR